MLTPSIEDKSSFTANKQDSSDDSKVLVRPGFLIGLLAVTVLTMNFLFVGIAFYLGVDIIPEDSTENSLDSAAVSLGKTDEGRMMSASDKTQ